MSARAVKSRKQPSPHCPGQTIKTGHLNKAHLTPSVTGRRTEDEDSGVLLFVLSHLGVAILGGC